MAVKDGTYRGVPVQERRAARRARLIAATLAVWGDEGGHRVTMTRICAEAGLTERYFYESFTGLDEALSAVLDLIAQQIHDAAVLALERTDGTPQERVAGAITAFVRILTDDPRKARVAIVESAAMPSLHRQRAGLLRHFVELSAREAARLVPGDLPAAHRELTATMFIGGLAELVSAWVAGTVTATPDDIIGTATRHFVATARP